MILYNVFYIEVAVGRETLDTEIDETLILLHYHNLFHIYKHLIQFLNFICRTYH